ncbi:MAG: LD-carboxypeptidase [Paludibacteraceae bacterium]|nr:LD-carboxypeptidase [Paludibacteraceae bacterium]
MTKKTQHIRIVSPSGVIDPSLIDAASARLREWGHTVSEGAHARDEWGRFAGTDEHRLADLCDALADPQVDLILCSRGGYGLQRIIDRVPPITKPILGFSDITALHQLAGLHHQPSLHGIMCKHIATLPEDAEPIVALRKILSGEPLEYTFAAHPLNRPGQVSAPLIGGNLSVLYGLQATPFSLSATLNSPYLQIVPLGKELSTSFNSQKPLLLIEDIGERHYHIDRMIRNLRMSGVLAHLGGLIVGQFSGCEDDPSMPGTVYQTINEAVADYNYPVLFNAPVGHVEKNMPVWLNRPATLSIEASSARLSWR